MSAPLLGGNDLLVLDTSVLGFITNPRGGDAAAACKAWLRTVLDSGIRVVLPEMADYELRRELLRADKLAGLAALDALKAQLIFVPINTAMMRMAAELWAQMRKQGRPTAPDTALDADVILAAQTLVAARAMACNPVIATENVGHLARMVAAHRWDTLRV